jgi:thioredoxin 2
VDQPVDVPGAVEFDELIAQSALPVLVDFWAPWCGPCKMVAPEFVKIAATGAGRWIVAKVNTEELPDLSARFNIRAIPTMTVFKNGIEVARQAGAMLAARIQQFIEQAAGTTR